MHEHPTLTNAIHYEALHGFSRQHLVSARDYLLAAAAGGLVPRRDFPLMFPKGLSQPQFSLTWFDAIQDSIRLGGDEDLNQLLELEQKASPEPLQRSAADIRDRLQYGLDVFVAERCGRIVGAIYTQRIQGVEEIFTASAESLNRHRHETGAVLVILGMTVLPEVAAEQLGAALIRFIVALSRVTSGIRDVIGVSRLGDREVNRGTSILSDLATRERNDLHADSVLKFHQANGAHILGVVPHFRERDGANLKAAVLIRYPLHEASATINFDRNASVISDVPGPSQILQDVSEISGQPLPETTLNSSWSNLPLDSLDFQELRIRLERRLGRPLERSVFLDFDSPLLLGEELRRRYISEGQPFAGSKRTRSNSHVTKVRIRPATEADANKAYRLRYQEFHRIGDNRYLNHATQEHRDALDGVAGSHLLVAIDSQRKVVGTMRLVERSQCQFFSDDAYSWQPLAELCRCDVKILQSSVLLCDRAAIEESHQRQGLFAAFVERAVTEASRLNKSLLIAVTATDNRQMQRSLRNLGFLMYGTARSGTFQGLAFVRQLDGGALRQTSRQTEP